MHAKNLISRLCLTALVLLLTFALMGANVYDDVQPQKMLLRSWLSGGAEMPGPGDPDGMGQAQIVLKMKNYQVCWKIKVMGITLPATAAHIHSGDMSVAGPVVVALSAPNEMGLSSGCVEVDKDLFMALQMNPDLYYVNVHNVDFPAGAVRGQLFLAE
ncbi:MAG: CHRD domain-containing protein [Chloroflexi bacterium HGW-Chloroflexi-10]|nr:MAG: CHRD domain-containing protein [Chloroflexi bacterium HGW-Chloroflexi-10]